MISVPTSFTGKKTKAPETAVELAYPYLCIRKTRKPDEVYLMSPVETKWDGRAYSLTKPDGECYNVFVGFRNSPDLCDCIGFSAKGVCKHTDSLRALVQRGEIHDPKELAPKVIEQPVNRLRGFVEEGF